jgi:hypothetical protein
MNKRAFGGGDDRISSPRDVPETRPNSSVGHLECCDGLVRIVAHQQRCLAVRHVEGNSAAHPLAGVQGASFQHRISGAIDRGLEESARLVKDLEVVWVVVD